MATADELDAKGNMKNPAAYRAKLLPIVNIILWMLQLSVHMASPPSTPAPIRTDAAPHE